MAVEMTINLASWMSNQAVVRGWLNNKGISQSTRQLAAHLIQSLIVMKVIWSVGLILSQTHLGPILSNQIKQWFNQGCASPDRGVRASKPHSASNPSLRLRPKGVAGEVSGLRCGLCRGGGPLFSHLAKKVGASQEEAALSGGGTPDLPRRPPSGARPRELTSRPTPPSGGGLWLWGQNAI